LATLPQTALANIVTNPGFETGDFTGWTIGGDTGFTGVDGSHPHSGTFAAFFGPTISNGTLSQTLATTPGDMYSIDFWLQNEDSGSNFFSVSFDGNVLSSTTDASSFDYTEFNFSGLASTSSTVLEFTFFNPPSFWDFDDVSVTDISSAVPEPLTIFVFGSGLAGAVAMRRRRKSKSA
jgi:hypothetical protein